jgi:hypothetical protein
MKTGVMILAAAAVVAAIFVDAKESFFDQEPSVCPRVQKGRYPQLDLEGVVDPVTSAEIIRSAEAYADANDGWTTSRHGSYPTTDLDTADVPSLRFPVHNIVYRKVIPRMAKAYNLNPLKLGIHEVFIAKYSADIPKHQKSLGEHVDDSDFSFVIALNDNFVGGGTKFAKSGAVKKPGVGSAVAFCGRSRHAGKQVTRGTRYILAGFLKYETPEGCAE